MGSDGRAGVLRMHGSCAARAGMGVLLLGRSGSGKSDLSLRLIERGFDLVADDQVVIEDGVARPPDNLAGLIEIRGIGLLHLPHVAPVRLALVLALDDPTAREAGSGEPNEPGDARLPQPRRDRRLGLPLLRIAAFEASAGLRVDLALDCIAGRRRLLAGFLEAGS